MGNLILSRSKRDEGPLARYNLIPTLETDCLETNRICLSYEEFAELGENKYKPITFGEVNFFGARKRNRSRPDCVDAWESLYRECHEIDPQCKHRGNDCNCNINIINHFEGKSMVPVTEPPTPPVMDTTSQ